MEKGLGFGNLIKIRNEGPNSPLYHCPLHHVKRTERP